MRRILCIFILLIAVAHRALPAALTIVQDGAARATIVIAKDEEHARITGSALQTYIEKMSGARLPIVVEGQGHEQPISIYVGHTTAAAAQAIAIPSGFNAAVYDDAFEEEGYVIKTKGDAIFIGGNADGPYAGNMYGGYAFLEKLGCRFYFPGDWGEVIPEQKTITVPELDVESRPDFALRYIGLNPGWVPMPGDEMGLYTDWRVKVGMTVRHASLYPLVGDGFLGVLLPPADHWEAHPEYYAMDKKGQRRIGEGDVNHTTMLCLSNPAVYEQVLANLKKAFAEEHYANGPNTHRISPNGFGISPPDGSPYCYCDNCQAASQNFVYDHYVEGPQMSEEFFGFTAKLAKEFPDKFVATMAYSLRELPPQGVELPRNTAIMYAPISCCAIHTNDDPHCWRRQEFTRLLGQYCRQTPHVYLYVYNPDMLTGLFVPERQTANVTVNIPIYKKLGVKGFEGEGRKAIMQTWTSFYVTAKLLWDADTDVAALKQDFYTSFFGPAAGPHLQAWWDALEHRLGSATIHPHEDFLLNNIYTVPFVKSVRHHIAAAQNAKATAAQRERIDAVALIADHVRGYADMEAAEMHLDYATAAAAAKRMFDIQAKLNKIYPFFISETFPDNPDTPEVEAPPPFVVRGRLLEYERLLGMTNGETGELVAPLPLDMPFARDPFAEGVVAEWYAPDYDDSAWTPKNTHLTWDAQDAPLDEKGHHYDGYGWYRGTFEVPANFADRRVSFHCGGTFNEGWVWINGKYVHHEPHKVWWWWSHPFDLDITDAIEPGKVNTIAIRVLNKAEQGGLLRRGFFWSPTE